MGNSYFQFKQFRVEQGDCAMKISTDAVLIGALSGINLPTRILDIGTGTGVIALMLAQRNPEAEIFGLEIDRGAYLQATENVRNSPWGHRITIIESPLQKYQHQGAKFDLIVSNPPYFPNHLLSNDTRRNQALHQDSLTFHELTAGVEKHLKEDGELWIILPDRQMREFELVAKSEGFEGFRRIEIRDSLLKPVLRVIQAFGRDRQKGSTLEVRELVIKGSNGEYSKDYRELLKKFMLHF